MLELILLGVTSIITARYLERRYRIASVLHAILFLVMSVTYFFASDNAFVSSIAKSMMSEVAYRVVHETMAETITVFHVGYSSILLVEIVTIASASVISLVFVIRRLKKSLANLRYRPLFPNEMAAFIAALGGTPKVECTQEEPIYLLTRRLRN